MKLLDFRIENFRSIVDTGWCPFSNDGITVLIGQNESGKSSVLAALEKSFSPAPLDDDDLRIGASLPKISLRLKVTFDEISEFLDGFDNEHLFLLEQFLHNRLGIIEFYTTWAHAFPGTAERFSSVRLVGDTDALLAAIDALRPSSEAPERRNEEVTEAESEDGEEEEEEEEEEEAASEALTTANIQKPLTATALGEAVYYAGPETVLFDETTGLLPNKIDIVQTDGSYSLSGNGNVAVENFLSIAKIDLSQLVSHDERARENILRRGNETVSAHFASFWSQTIGKKDRLYLRCDLKYHNSNSKTPGRPYLVFWISDGLNHLYPKQRSTGVRWFLSFYLQLTASDQSSSAVNTFFLLDEPGANLHERAQSDVLKLINKLNDKRQIMYSTHSPHMIEYDKIYRVLAVQREGDQDDTPTTLIHAHRLGAASRDTLSPLLTAMGSDFSRQDVISKEYNVILEEMSAYYYLRSFWILTDQNQKANLIAATGANNVEGLANMFVGWGLQFIVVVDDDSAGRSAYNSLKRHMFGDKQDLAGARMLRIDGKGIEDIFDRDDFRKFVLDTPHATYTVDNSQHVKDSKQAKAVLAYQFYQKVTNADIKWNDLSKTTKAKVTSLVEAIASRLKDKA